MVERLPDAKWLVCTDDRPSSVMCLITPLSRLEGVDCRVVHPNRCTPDDLRWADFVAFGKRTEAAVVRIMDATRLLGRPSVIELDDDLLATPIVRPLAHPAVKAGSLLRLQYLLLAATRVHTYTQQIAAAVAELGPDSVRAPVYFDESLVRAAVRTRPFPGQEAIAFPSERTDLPATRELIVDLLRAILQARPQATVHLWREYPELPADRVVVHPPQLDYNSFVRELASLDLTVGLAPLGASAFENAKSNAKYRDLGGCGVPSVFSPSPVYGSSVTHGVTGLVAANEPAAWVAAVARLADDPGTWLRMRDAVVADVSQRYPLSGTLDFWRTTTREMAQVAAAPMPRPGNPWAPELAVLGDADYGQRVRGIVAAGAIEGKGVTVWHVINEWESLPDRAVVDAWEAPPDVQRALVEQGGAFSVIVSAATFPELVDLRPPVTARLPGSAVYVVDQARPGVQLSHCWEVAIGMAVRDQAFDWSRTSSMSTHP